MHHKVWDEVIHPFPNINGTAVDVCLAMDKQFHPTPQWACDYISMLGLKLIYVSKLDPGVSVSETTMKNMVREWYESTSIGYKNRIDIWVTSTEINS